MGADYSPDASLIGLQWPLGEASSWTGQSLAKAITQRFALDSPSTAADDPTLAVWVYCANAAGAGRYGVEVATSAERSAYAEPITIRLDGLVASGGWSVVGAGSILDAIDDAVGVPDDDDTYILAASETTLLGQSTAADLAPIDGERVLAIEIEARCLSDQVGARVQAALRLNGVDYRGPGSTVSIEEWTTYSTRFVYNPQGLSSWPDNDALELELGGEHSWGVKVGAGVRVTQVIARIYYGPETRLGGYQTSYVFAPGWNEIAYPALLDDAQDYYLTISPIVVDGANYATFPILTPAPDATHEATEQTIEADNTIDSADGTELGGTLGFVIAKQDSAEGSVYHSVAVASGDNISNAVYAGRDETQILVGESLTVDAVLARVLAPAGTPTDDLTIRLESGPASAPVAEAEAVIPAGSVARAPANISAALDASTALVVAAPYRLVATSDTEAGKPYRVARARTDTITIPASLIGSPAYEDAFDWTAVGDSNREFCVDDPPGQPDDDQTYIVDDQPTALQAGMNCLEDALNAVTGRAIAAVDVVWRAGSGFPANRVTGWLSIGGDQYESRDVSDATPNLVQVSTAWNTYRFRWPTNPDTGVAWTPADIIDFDGNGASSWGVENVVAGTDIFITQMYLQVRFADEDLADDLTYGGLDAAEADDALADLVLMAGERPDAPTGLTATWDIDAYAVDLTWSSIGSLSYALRRDCAGTWRDVDGDVAGGSFTDYTSPLSADLTYGLFAVSASGLESAPATVAVSTPARLDAIGTNEGETAQKLVVVSWPIEFESGRDEQITPSLTSVGHLSTRSPVIRADQGEVVVELWPDVTDETDEGAQFWALDELRRQYGRLWLRVHNDRYCAPMIVHEVAREIDTQHRIRARLKVSGLERWPC